MTKLKIFLQKVPKWIIASLTAFFVVLLIVLLVFSELIYLKQYPIVFNEVTPMSLQEFMTNEDLIKKEDKILLVVNERKFDALCIGYIENAKKNDPEYPQVKNFHYDTAKGMLYLSFESGKGYDYTFSIQSEIKVEDNNIKFSIGKSRLGSKGQFVVREVFEKLSTIGSEFDIPTENTESLILLENITIDKDIEIAFVYAEAILKQKFEHYFANIDKSRGQIHKKNNDIPEAFIELLGKEAIDTEAIHKCLEAFEKDTLGARKFTWIMNMETIDTFYSDFSALYFKNMSLEELKAYSEADSYKGISAYHENFLAYFYQYLNDNKNYELSNNNLFVSGSQLDSETIFNAYEPNERIYPIDLVVENSKVHAVYTINNDEIKKVIFSRR